MKLAVFLTGLAISVLLSLACLAAILVYFNPAYANSLIFLLLYLSLFISSAGIFSLIGLLIRKISHRRVSASRASRQLWDSFRQGVFLSIILTIALILQSRRMVCWWNILILVGVIGLIEFWAMRR